MRTSLFATFSLLLLTVLPVNSGNETHSFFLFSQFVPNTSWIIEFDLKHSTRSRRINYFPIPFRSSSYTQPRERRVFEIFQLKISPNLI